MDLKKLLSQAKSTAVRLRWKEIAATAVIAVLAGIIILPPVGQCLENGSSISCDSCMYTIMDKLSWHLSNDSENGEWLNMMLNGESDKALKIIAEEAERENSLKINLSDYYFRKQGNIIYLLCRKHSDKRDSYIAISEDYEKPELGVLGWNSNQKREITDLSPFGGSSFTVDAGTEGKYCVSAWAWENYTADANAEGDKVYGASVIFYNGTYYYYPDGFKVRKNSANKSPLRYALDTDNASKSAYCIPIDTSSVLDSRFSSDSREGSLLAENGKLYIWQPRPSKQYSKGWIKIECENKKL